jgi:hypothetical protein
MIRTSIVYAADERQQPGHHQIWHFGMGMVARPLYDQALSAELVGEPVDR